jgi:hypothetical protein
MPEIVAIVEGAGEVASVPGLLRRIVFEHEAWDITIGRALNANGKSNLLKPKGIEGFLRAAIRTNPSALLIVLDADRDCPYELARGLATRIRTVGVRQPVAIVCAKPEFEAWFLASYETIAGRTIKGEPGVSPDVTPDEDVEALSSVKWWLKRQMVDGTIYKESYHQAALTELIDIPLARTRSRSFRRLCHAVEQLIESIRDDHPIITP